ncbi:MAG TPA: entry exclusion 1 domain-containing protein [Alphaproteobacteria bacterium]|jgi:vacuolar-type H+-ATPase subunit I/STV1
MAKVGAQRAAELTGRSKSTVQRAMKNGKLSYEVDNNGRRVIDVAELDRAFGLMPQETDRRETSNVEAELEKASQMLEAERMKMRIRMLEEQIEATKDIVEDLKEQRDQWQKQAQQVLLTSQYSQKQAEELKAELKEREARARARRQQELERKMQGMKGDNQNQSQPQSRTIGPIERIKQEAAGVSFDIQSLWHKIRGEDKVAVEEETEKTADAA